MAEDWQTEPLPENLPPLPYPDTHCDWEAIWTTPDVAQTAWVAPGATVLGRVRLAPRSSVWYGCVLRGDGEFIEVGADSNVQDGSILHVDEGFPCVLGDRVTVGHRAVVHASTVEDDALIAIGAVVLSRCVIGSGAVVAAGALLKEGTEVPPGTVWAGCPARQIGEVTPELQQRLRHTWQHYVNKAVAFAARYGSPPADSNGRN